MPVTCKNGAVISQICHLQARHSTEESEHETRRYMQRYFVCDDFWKQDGPIFFYLGNEADVLLCGTCSAAHLAHCRFAVLYDCASVRAWCSLQQQDWTVAS